MGTTQRFLGRKAAERIPDSVLDAAGRGVLAAVDRAVEIRWDAARRRAHDASGADVGARVRSVTRSFTRELTTIGAATGAAAAAPGLGTASAASILVAEVGWFAFRATDLIMTIGAVHGRVGATADERRAWVLSILAFGPEAAEEFVRLANELDGDDELTMGGERLGTLVAGVATGDAATIDALRRLNANLATRVVARFGSRRGLLTIGKLLPFGIGAVVGGSANWAMARAVSAQARRFFSHYEELLPPSPPMLGP